MTPAWETFLREVQKAAEALPNLLPVMLVALPPAGAGVEKPTTIWWGEVPDVLRRQLLTTLGRGTLGPRERLVDVVRVDLANVKPDGS